MGWFDGVSEWFGDVATGGQYSKFKANMQSWDPNRDNALGGGQAAPFAQEAATYNKQLNDSAALPGPLGWAGQNQRDTEGALRDPWTNSIIRPQDQNYAKVKDYYAKLNGYQSAGSGGQQASPVQVMQAPPAQSATPTPQAPVAPPAQSAIPHQQANSAAGVQQAAQNSPYLTKINESLDRFRQRYDQLYGQISNLQDPYDPNSELFKKALAGTINVTNRNFGGAAGRTAAVLAARGQLGSAGAAGAIANTENARRTALSDAETGMYRDALAQGQQFTFNKLNALASMNQGDLATAGGIYQGLYGIERDDARFDRDMAFREDQAGKALGLQQQQLDLQRQGQADDREFRAESLKIQREAFELAKTQGMEDRQAEVVSNAIAATPGLLKSLKDHGLDLKDVWDMIFDSKPGQPSGGSSAPYYLGGDQGAPRMGGGGPSGIPGIKLGDGLDLRIGF